MNYKCVYCGNEIDRTDGHCSGCGAIAAATLFSDKEPTQDYDYAFACKSVDGYKVVPVGNSNYQASTLFDNENKMNKENLGLKQLAFHIRFTNLGKNTINLFFYSKFSAGNEQDNVLPIKLFADDELTSRSSVGPIDPNLYKEVDGKSYPILGQLYNGIYMLQCDPGTMMEGWVGFYVPFKAQVLKLVIGSKQISLKNPFYTP